MDDHHSRQQIDELAELYLTSLVGDHADTDATEPADNPLEGPAPIRLSPKVGDQNAGDHATQAPNDDEPLEPQDRHPVLRLADEDHEEVQDVTMFDSDQATATMAPPADTAHREDPAPRKAPQAVLEAVVMGNLPGMSGPWLTQYAQLLAQTDGPVALLHIGDGAIDMELIEPRAEAQPAPTRPTSSVRIPPMREGMSGLVGLLDALVTSDKSPTRTVLVRIEAPGDAVTLSRLAAIDDWTVLCGSDETAAAGVVQQLRTVVRADPRLADRSVGLMVMGSDETAARETANKVANELEDDLVNRVELIGHLKRMQPAQVREIGSFPDPISVWPQLVSWFDTLETPEPLEPITAHAPKPPEPQPAPQPEPEPADDPARSARLSPQAARLAKPATANAPASSAAPTPAFRHAPPARQAPGARPRPATSRPPARQQSTTAATPSPATPQHAVAAEPTRPAPQPRVLSPQPELDLVALIGQGAAALDDPATLDARIPGQPDTQLAVDSQGVVHILNKGAGVVSDDVMQLIEAGRWVRDNLELIALTQRERVFVDTDPVLHLLTDRADQATTLVGKLAGQIRLHLLQQVMVGKATGWFCTPLG